MPQQPHDRGRHLFTEIRSDHHDALAVALVQDSFLQVGPVEEFADDRGGLAPCAAMVTVEVGAEDFDDLAGFQAGAIGCVFQRLPDQIPPGVVELVLDQHKLAVLVERQQVKPFARLVETVEFLLDNEQVFPEGIGRTDQPFLKVLPLPEAKLAKTTVFQARQTVGRVRTRSRIIART